MILTDAAALPPAYHRILARSQAIQFSMNSDVLTGTLLRSLAASKPGGRILELGTGCGLSTCWLLDGMSSEASLVSVDTEAAFQAVAHDELGTDSRLTLVLQDGGDYLTDASGSFDLIFADAWPGKFSHLEEALRLVAPGGIYIVDDMLPQPNWPPGHAPKADALAAHLQALPGFVATTFQWSTGVIVCVKR
jgi:predicted O-methyltransferase YrrM